MAEFEELMGKEGSEEYDDMNGDDMGDEMMEAKEEDITPGCHSAER
jgi:hypothetical protein